MKVQTFSITVWSLVPRADLCFCATDLTAIGRLNTMAHLRPQEVTPATVSSWTVWSVTVRSWTVWSVTVRSWTVMSVSSGTAL